MYRLNNLETNVLITPDEVIKHLPGDHTLDRIKFEHSIIIAEERFIRPALTDVFYNQLSDEKNRLVTSTNKLELQTLIISDEANTEIILTEGQIINAAEFLTANHLKLWKKVLWKLIAECVVLIAMPNAYIQMQSSGLVLSNPPANPLGNGGVVSPDLKSVKWIMDYAMLNRIDPMLTALHNFICANKLNYPNYTKQCECKTQAPAKQTDLVLGVYDAQPDKCCGSAWDQLNGL